VRIFTGRVLWDTRTRVPSDSHRYMAWFSQRYVAARGQRSCPIAEGLPVNPSLNGFRRACSSGPLELKKLGGTYSKSADMGDHVVEDGLLITGQNPASPASEADALLAKLATLTAPAQTES